MSMRVLVIDDELFRLAYRREEFLARWNLFPDQSFERPLEYVFISSQRTEDDCIINDESLAVDFVAQSGAPWALVLLDMQFDYGPLLNGEPIDADTRFGLRIQAALERHFPELPIIQFTAQAQKDLGQQDGYYLSKIDGSLDDLRLALVERGRVSLEDRRRLLRVPVDTVIASDNMIRVYAEVYRRARADTPLLILGETGTGKEHLARYFHEISPHAAGELVAVQVSSIPSTLYEGELFGYEKGAFTGAERSHVGVFSRADAGTLFLDEIGALPQDLQAKLLRAVGERVFRRLGGTADLALRCGIVAATQDRLADIGFRQDLLARFAVVEIPPLRDRPEDVPFLAEHFLDLLQRKTGKRGIVLSTAAVQALVTAELFDNARGLRAAIERAVLQLSSNSVIQPRHLGEMSPGVPMASLALAASTPAESAPATPNLQAQAARQEVPADIRTILAALKSARSDTGFDALRGLLAQGEQSFGEFRRELALAALRACRHPVSGKLRVLPAMQLITGNAGMSPMQAKRKLNEILGNPQAAPLDLARIESELTLRGAKSEVAPGGGSVAGVRRRSLA